MLPSDAALEQIRGEEKDEMMKGSPAGAPKKNNDLFAAEHGKLSLESPMSACQTPCKAGD